MLCWQNVVLLQSRMGSSGREASFLSYEENKPNFWLYGKGDGRFRLHGVVQPWWHLVKRSSRVKTGRIREKTGHTGSKLDLWWLETSWSNLQWTSSFYLVLAVELYIQIRCAVGFLQWRNIPWRAGTPLTCSWTNCCTVLQFGNGLKSSELGLWPLQFWQGNSHRLTKGGEEPTVSRSLAWSREESPELQLPLSGTSPSSQQRVSSQVFCISALGVEIWEALEGGGEDTGDRSREF